MTVLDRESFSIETSEDPLVPFDPFLVFVRFPLLVVLSVGMPLRPNVRKSRGQVLRVKPSY